MPERLSPSQEIQELLGNISHESPTVSEKILYRLKELFGQVRPQVSKNLALFLGEQQQSHWARGQLLFADNLENELSVFVHARVYGSREKTTSDDIWPESFKKLSKESSEKLKELYQQLCAPLMPESISWGATGHLQSNVIAALDSPVMHAWLYYDNNDINKRLLEAIITGRGIPGVSDQVVSAALSASIPLMKECQPNDFIITPGFIRIKATDIPRDELRRFFSRGIFQKFLPSFLQRTRVTVVSGPLPLVEINEVAEDAMMLFQKALVNLETDTGFVQVHHCSRKTYLAFESMLEGFREREDKQVYVWAYNNEKIFPSPDKESIVITQPYFKVPGGFAGTLFLTLTSEILETAYYKNLIEIYQRSLIGRLLADAKRRTDFYKEEIDRLTKQKSEYEKLSETEKAALPPVVTDREINFEYGIEVPIESEEIPASIFYERNIPHLIKTAQEWKDKTTAMIENITPLITWPDAALNRLCTSRLFDCALRDVAPTDDTHILETFCIWKKTIQPMLWLEWRNWLKGEEIEVADVCTRHTFFTVSMDLGKDQFYLLPQTIIDAHRSAVIIDPKRKVQVTLDATDYAEPVESERGKPFSYDNLTTDEMLNSEKLREKIFLALKSNPKETAEAIIAPWIPNPLQFADQDKGFNQLCESVGEKIRPLYSTQTLSYMNSCAYHTAYETILKGLPPKEQNIPSIYAAVFLMQAVLECYRQGVPYGETLRNLLNGIDTLGRSEIPTFFSKAKQLDQSLVEKFLDTGELSISFKACHLGKAEQGIVNFWRTRETLEMVQTLATVIKNLNQVEESRFSVYAKIASPFEKASTPRFIDKGKFMDEYIRILLGEVKSSSSKT